MELQYKTANAKCDRDTNGDANPMGMQIGMQHDMIEMQIGMQHPYRCNKTLMVSNKTCLVSNEPSHNPALHWNRFRNYRYRNKTNESEASQTRLLSHKKKNVDEPRAKKFVIP